MEVLRFETKDYTISVKTADIFSPWSRFKRRVLDDADVYCSYASNRDGKLSLFFVESNQLAEVTSKDKYWDMLPPVLFETCIYQFFVEFHGIKSEPRVHHPLREVADGFSFYRGQNEGSGCYGGILTGSVNFLNSPGTFVFSFDYVDRDGHRQKDILSMDVVSPKLDTKKDLKSITYLINEEYENYVFEYLTTTFQSLQVTRQGLDKSNVVWLAIFKNVIERYFTACEFIVVHANRRTMTEKLYAHADRIKKWSVSEEEKYANQGAAAENRYYSYQQALQTIDTRENRFVKYTLLTLGKRYTEVAQEIKQRYKGKISTLELDLLDGYKARFSKHLNSRFFRSVGKFEGMKQESQVLQQRTGYNKVYKYYLILRSCLNLEKGQTDIGMKKIWELYEVWCFLVMKKLLFSILGLNPLDPNDAKYIEEDSFQLLESMQNNDIEHVVKLTNPLNEDHIELRYQHTYNRDDNMTRSLTNKMRPDIVLNITRAKEEFTLTYLYDAKYRVNDDQKYTGSDELIADEPTPDSINAMHRYRDAIYYGFRDITRPQGKEVIGGYILFPGRTNGIEKVKDKYFIKSIESVNIGAFPLLPSIDKTIECPLFEERLRSIILKQSTIQQIEDSIPQKGLYYTKYMPKEEMVYVGYVKRNNSSYEDFISHNAKKYYTGTNDTKPTLDLQSIRFFMPIIGGKIDGIYPVIRINAATKKQKKAENEEDNDNVRFFLILGEFIPFGDPISVKKRLHNAEYLTLAEAKELYRTLKDSNK